ncbi:MAG: 16S rRNA (uracil(1498)-N(3))-methyltransferase [Clostridia bacterium]|nr:16S rRNA (uracil(1498)-N(3))-methyltransferase [Clostridia bacterium]
MPRFFVSKENINEEECMISILGEDAFHIARSLRMSVGDSLTVCDGEGRDYDCTLTKIRDDRVDCDINEAKPCPAEPPYKAMVYQALVKGERLDVAIQKSVEFGASAIVPFESSRCIVRMKGEKEGSKSQRRRRIAAEAAKQCGRGIVPDVTEPMSFGDMLSEAAKCDLAIFCYEKEGERMLGTTLESLRAEPPKSVAIVVGPEGGFSPEEAERAEAAGLSLLGLGRRILRTESAAAFVLACLSSEFELR